MITTIARPYAKAAFEYAFEHQALTTWSNLLSLAATIVADAQMTALLKNPKVSKETILDILKDTLEKSSAGILDEATCRFLSMLAQANRLTVLPSIFAVYESYRADAEKTVDVRVTSVHPLQDPQREALSKALEQRFQRKIVMHCAEDPSLLGGFVVRSGDFVIDASVRSQLGRLTQTLCA